SCTAAAEKGYPISEVNPPPREAVARLMEEFFCRPSTVNSIASTMLDVFGSIPTQMDYKGQKLAEQIFQGIILVSAVIALTSVWTSHLRGTRHILLDSRRTLEIINTGIHSWL
uniref:Signal peptidase complex subunit 1 n=1 Tax=Chelonoidis abingdonii TaxID=106734 RepID=A0A8C0ISK6_CHEAB